MRQAGPLVSSWRELILGNPCLLPDRNGMHQSKRQKKFKPETYAVYVSGLKVVNGRVFNASLSCQLAQLIDNLL